MSDGSSQEWPTSARHAGNEALRNDGEEPAQAVMSYPRDFDPLAGPCVTLFALVAGGVVVCDREICAVADGATCARLIFRVVSIC